MLLRYLLKPTNIIPQLQLQKKQKLGFCVKCKFKQNAMIVNLITQIIFTRHSLQSCDSLTVLAGKTLLCHDGQ